MPRIVVLINLLAIWWACSAKNQNNETPPDKREKKTTDSDSKKNPAGDNSLDLPKKPSVVSNAGEGQTPTDDNQGFSEVNYQNNQYPLRINQPISYQVFQRQTLEKGTIVLELNLPSPEIKFLRVRLLESAIQKQGSKLVTYQVSQTNFRATVEAKAGGWYTLEIFAFDQNKAQIGFGKVDYVGVGEVFVIAGQSNSTNCGEVRMQTQSRMVASTDGRQWKIGNDPQIGAHDLNQVQGCNQGSSWPVAGDLLYQQLKVPIAFASTGYSGTTIAEWQPNVSGRQLFSYSMERLRQLINQTGVRAVLWHQGESDSPIRTSYNSYYDGIKNIVQASRQQLGSNIAWVIAQVTYCADYHYDRPWGVHEPVRQAQAAMWNFPNVFPGPDTDQLRAGQYRHSNDQNCHFSRLGLETSGRMWADKIVSFLNKTSTNN